MEKVTELIMFATKLSSAHLSLSLWLTEPLLQQPLLPKDGYLRFLGEKRA